MGLFKNKKEYELIQEIEINEGDVILYHGTGILSCMIRCFSKSRVNHAGLYMGSGIVMEATKEGVHETKIANSIAKSKFILIMRHRNNPESMEAVLKRARMYKEMDIRYEFEGIAFLALISLVGKFYKSKKTSWLITKILKQWFSIFLKDKTRQPMICSEFVYRCYNGVKSNGEDLTLVVDTMPMIRSVYTAGCESSIEKRRNLVKKALKAAEAERPDEPAEAGNRLSEEEVMETIKKFSMNFLKDHDEGLKGYRDEKNMEKNLLQYLMETIPHFVTPRDLHTSDSLEKKREYTVKNILRHVDNQTIIS